MALGAAILVIVGSAVILAAEATPQDSLLRQKQVQERVRTMARELVGGVLDIQLQQLRENGLESHEVYRDIKEMRKNLDMLIDKEMPEVIKLLAEIERAEGPQRDKTFVTTREKSRGIVVALVVQRLNLMRRLKIAEMAAQVRQLIQVQGNVLGATEKLPEQPAARREALSLSTLEDQRDVRAVYRRFKDSLDEVSRWAGPFGAEAAAGARLLKQGRVDDELAAAETKLQAASYPEAAGSQKTVIRGLQALLVQIERAQGMAEADRDATAERIREMIAKQEQLRQQTKQPNLDQAKAEQLVNQQTGLRKDISSLKESVENADVQQALDKAQQAAYEATADLFEQKQQDAAAQQDNVLNNLKKAADLAETLRNLEFGLTADQYRKRIEDLKAARKDLEKVEQEQKQAQEKVAQQPAEAGTHEAEASKELAKIPQNRDLPDPVKSRMAEAKDATAEAAADTNKPAAADRETAVQRAGEAVERAVSETEAALADAKREQLLSKVNELAHAARALDQAAQTERDISKETAQAAQEKGVEEQRAKEIGQDQGDVKSIAQKVAEGVKSSVPEATRTLAEAGKPIAEGGKQLESAGRTPGEASKPAAKQASQETEKAAGQIAKAAQQVREEMRRAAQQLQELGGEQLAPVRRERQDVEQNLADTMESLAARMQRLAEAREKVAQAQVDQDRAAGRPESAKARQAGEKIRKALERQKEAEAAADTLTRSRSGEPREAVAKQQEVAKSAGEAAQESGTQDELGQSLKQAEAAAKKAAEGLTQGNRSQAKAAQADARQALEKAAQLARAAQQAAAKQSSEQPTGQEQGDKPDAGAQKQVTEAAQQAGELSRTDAPEAAGTLGKATDTSKKAEQDSGKEDKKEVAVARDATAGLLDKAAAELDEAQKKLAEQAAQRMVRQAKQAAQLAGSAVPVDPGANAALRHAQHQAEAGAQNPPSPQEAQSAHQGVQQSVGEAASSLAQRGQEIADDMAKGAAIAKAADKPAEKPSGEQVAGEPGGEESGGEEAGGSEPGGEEPGGHPGKGHGQPAGAMPNAPLANQAIREAAQLAAALAGTPEGAEPGEMGAEAGMPGSHPGTKPGVAQDKMPGATNPLATRGGVSQSGTRMENQAVAPMPLQEANDAVAPGTATPNSDKDAEPGDQKYLARPWFAKLPPELRSAIRNNSQRRPPRGYEDRMKRYFENMD